MTSLTDLTAKLLASQSTPISLSVEENKTLVGAIQTRSFVSLTMKYSRFVSVKIEGLSHSSLTVDTLGREATNKWESL